MTAVLVSLAHPLLFIATCTIVGALLAAAVVLIKEPRHVEPR